MKTIIHQGIAIHSIFHPLRKHFGRAMILAAIGLGGLLTPTSHGQTNTNGCYTAPAGLVGWWRAENNALDEIHTNSGTLVGGMGYAAGRVGQAFVFDGVDDGVVIPDAELLNVGPGEDFTVEAWIQAEPHLTDYGVMSILSKRVAPTLVNAHGFELALHDGKLGAQLADEDDQFQNFVSAGPDLIDGAYHHVAMTVNRAATNGGQLYVDGQVMLVFDPTQQSGDLGTAAPFKIGKHAADWFNGSFKGRVDEAAFYLRALATNEIAAIYHAGSLGKCASPTNPPPAITGVPAIINFSPKSALIGSQIIITGTNFSPVFASNIVYFGGTRAVVSAATPTNLVVTLPPGATHDPISVTVNGRTALSPTAFLPTFSGSGTNISTGSFAAGQNLTVADGPLRSIIADLDNDGKPDLIEANAYAHNVSIFRSISVVGTLDASSFAPRVDLPSHGGTDSPRCMTVADVDGDGKLDILVGDQATSGIFVYRNISTPGVLNAGSFAAPVGFAAGGYPHGLRVADLDGDGLPEILVANYSGGFISILKNTGSAGSLTTNSFAPQYALVTGPGPTDVGIADLNGDGRPDLVTTAFDGSQLSLFRNVASPMTAVSNWFTLDATLPALAGSLEITMTDMDGDTKSDLVIATVHGYAISVYRNQAGPGVFTTNSFAARVDYSTPGWVHTISVADFNGDAKPDLAAVGELDSYLGVFQNQSSPGNILLAPRVDFATGWNAWGVAAGDLDGDNRADIVFANAYDDTLTFYRNIMTEGSNTNPPSGSCVAVPNGAISWWRGEGNALDNIRTNNGTLVGGVMTVPGKVGSGFGFDGTGYVVVPHDPSLNCSNALTIELWYKSTHNTNLDYGLIDKRMGSGWANFGINVVAAAGLGVYYDDLAVLDGDDIGSSFETSRYTPIPAPGVFHHLAATYWQISNNLVQVQTYLNGQNVRTRYLAGNLANTINTTPVTIGATSQGGGEFFKGVIDEVTLYNRVLTPAEIQSIYAADTAGKCGGIITNPPWLSPTITQQPQGVVMIAGSDVLFNVVATGLPAPSYQWYFGGDLLPGQTSATLTLTNAQLAQSGAYAVRVSNPYGSILSSNAILTVVTTQAVLLVDANTPGFYNDSLGTILDGTAPQFPLPFGQGDDPTFFPADEPNLAAGAGILGNWLTNPPNLNTNWRTVAVVPTTWELNTETAIIYPLDGGQFGVANLQGDFDADNGIYVWINGQYKFGARQPGLPSPIGQFEYTNVFLGSLAPGSNYIQILREDSGISVGYQIRLTGTALSTNGLPPVISQSPTNQSVAAGSSALFTVVAVGTSDLSYQWRFQGENLAGQTGNSLALLNVQPTNAGNYSVLVSNPYGSVTSSIATLTVLTYPPVITRQPTNFAAFVTTAASFSVQATGSMTLTYQWLLNGSPLAGKTATTLSFPSVQFSNAGNYSVIITNPYGAVTSSVAALTVNPIPPCASVHDGLVSWWKGENNMLDNWDSNNAGPFGNYQQLGKVGRAFISPLLTVADSTSLRMTNGLTIEAWINPSSITGARVILSKYEYPLQGGGSQSAYLLGLTNNGALFFILTPNGSTRTNATLFATNTLPVNQWSHVAATYDGVIMRLYLNGVPVAQTNYTGRIFAGTTPLGIGGFPSGTSSPWQFSGLLDEVSIYNRALSTTEVQAIVAADLTGKCLAPPVITQQPQNQAVPLGEDVKLTATITGSRPLTYQWYLNGPLTQFTTQRILGATNAFLVIEKVKTNNTGAYSLRVTNSVGFDLSAPAQITLLPAPTCTEILPGLISWWPGDTNTLDTTGLNNIATYSPASYPTGKVASAFTFNGFNSRIQINNTASLNFGSNANFSIEMWIRATNAQVQTGAPYPNIPLFEKRTTVSEPFWVGYSLSLSQGRLAFAMGVPSSAGPGVSSFVSTGPDLRDAMFHHVAMTVNRSTTNGGVLYVDGVPVLTFNPKPLNVSLVNTSPLFIGAPTVTLSNSYFAGLIDEPAIYNRDLTAAEILSIRTAGAAGRCKAPPFIVTQPMGGFVAPSSNFTLTVVATGTPALRYQWRKNVIPVNGATNATLNLTNVTFANAGTYSVIVSNAFGSVTSSNAVVTLNRLPIANADALNTPSNTPAVFAAAKLTLNDTDADGDLLFVTSVSTNSAQNGTVSLVAGQMTYSPPTNYVGNDTFTYLLVDKPGATAIGTVMVTVGNGGAAPLNIVFGPVIDNGQFVARFAGIPGLTYTIEAAPSLQGAWIKVANVTAPMTDTGLGIGVFEFREPVGGAASRYYRTIYPSY